MRLQLGDWLFQPGWPSTLATLLLLPLLLGLGFWQSDRARQKAELQTAFAERFQRSSVPLADVDPADPAQRYVRVSASGRYDDAHQLLLDNQVRDGQAGYHVLTPLRLNDHTAVLVNRGWLPLGASRQTLPDVAVPEESVTVTGWLAQPANPGLWWGEATGAASTWPRVVPYVDYQRLGVLLNYPLQAAVILLEPDAPAGYWRDWQPRFGGIGPERHRGYAAQWFGLAASLLILYLAINISRSSRVD
ncbi:MAG: SURF1 family protein [Candidatus Competibacteraceae bacterium]|nr:SURF1 family protein [Candidatus Competibacteraceae bacterium]MBK8898733.1 SURF1 family protein [Candidatus Competibacteraceae bacterium]